MENISWKVQNTNQYLLFLVKEKINPLTTVLEEKKNDALDTSREESES